MTILDDEFKYYITNTSCNSVLKLPYKDRCMMARKVPDCQSKISYFNYFEIIYCFLRIEDKTNEKCLMLLLIISALIYTLTMAVVVDTFFTPALKILSMKLHMNEYLAGVTLLAFGNSSPDLIANLMPIRAESAMFTGTISNAIAIVLLCGGMICYLKPFKIDAHSTARDLLFLLLAMELLRQIMFSDDSVSTQESIVFLSVYIIFLVINIVDLILLRQTIKELRQRIIILRSQPISPERNDELKHKIGILDVLQQNEIMDINSKHKTKYFIHKNRFSRTHDELDPCHRDGVDYKSMRSILHSENNPKNLYLCVEFLESVSPIDIMDWQLTGRCGRFLIIVKCPLVFILKIFVPIVDYERYKHGWSKLLNCSQIITNPFILITALHSKISSEYNSWYIHFNINYSKWSFCLTVPLAIIVFIHTRTDLPPSYHILFITLSFSSSLVIIVLCACEIQILTYIVGIIFELSDSFMDITLGSVANAFIDIISNVTVTMQGYEKMAFAAIIGGPLFSIVVTVGISLLFNENVRRGGTTIWLYGEQGENCYIFFWITVVTTLLWCLIFNFFARRSAGIFSWIIFLLFLLFSIATEWNLVHEFINDQNIILTH